MDTYISMLRGINVSGQKMINMADLRLLCENLGFKNVQTYIQSGNIIFQSETGDKQVLTRLIRDGIYRKFGFEIPVLVKNLDELKEVTENNPFLNGRSEDIRFLHVTFLSLVPLPENVQKIQGVFDPDEYAVKENNIYLYCPNGYGNTKLNNNYLENKLKVTATTRNWKTTLELLSIAEKTTIL